MNKEEKSNDKREHTANLPKKKSDMEAREQG